MKGDGWPARHTNMHREMRAVHTAARRHGHGGRAPVQLPHVARCVFQHPTYLLGLSLVSASTKRGTAQSVNTPQFARQSQAVKSLST